MKYIIEFEDEPCMREDGLNFYKCIQAPWWGLSEEVIKYLTPYQPDAPDTNVGNITNLCAHENDPISRQMAIDTIMGQPPEPHYPSWYAAQIEKLSAAQPEIIRCRDCKFAHITNDGRYCKYCDMFTDDYGQLIEMYFDSNFYCGYAERRTE